MIVTIDGPAASGKSSTADAVAERLGFRHLESGALYRGLTCAALSAGLAPDQWDALEPAQLDALDVRAEAAERGFRIRAGADDITSALRTPEVNRHVSRMAKVPAVRTWLLGRLRDAARGVDLVADGRDMGTVVFPDADVKIFLTASLEERARRRVLEHANEVHDDALANEMTSLAERDRVDTERDVAPLRPAPDAIRLDTTGLTFEQQVERIVALVRQARLPSH